MSESLVVHCEECGATKRFEGKDTVELIRSIENDDWRDVYNREEWDKLPHGHITGFCPEHANNEGE
jgi:hypothetical protein